MNQKSKQTSQKLNGVYYTPLEIVDFFLDWTIDAEKKQVILEPSAGEGRFVNNIKNINDKSKIYAIEIDEKECKKINKSKNTKVINDDFYNFYEKNKKARFDVVVGNPPYIRYQFLLEEQRIYQSDILKRNGMKPNKLINSWVAFTVASLELLKPNGKIAFILPTDILQVSYAKQLRKHIFSVLKEVNIINFNEVIFKETQQDVILLLGVKKESSNDKTSIRIINSENLFDLPYKIDTLEKNEYVYCNSDKWGKFSLENTIREFYDSKFVGCTDSFTDICKTEVGVTTGNNKFFVVNEKTIKDYRLEAYRIPLVGRSTEVTGLFYTNEDLLININKDNNVWLLDFNNKKIDKNANKYLKYGTSTEQDKGYKLSIRQNWYEVPSIWNPDAFMLRRMGKHPKIVKNNIDATSTDTFHRIKLNNKKDMYKMLVLFYSSVSMLTFELEGRIFGGGALEILPGDLNNIRIPKLTDTINFEPLANELDYKLKSNYNIEEIVKWVDDKILNFVMFSQKEMNDIYETWKSLNKKRIS